MCTCLLPVTQQMDKDLPNGSGTRAGVCLPVGQAQEGDHKHHLWSSVTWKMPLVPIQGQLLFPVAVTERVAGPGLPDQPHPHCP